MVKLFRLFEFFKRMKNQHILKLAVFALFAWCPGAAEAQYTYDAFRFSETGQTGTARFQAMGGNHTALGGDASTIGGNPAGLAFYNRSELSISPGFSNFRTETSYLNGNSYDSRNNFNLPNFSLVLGGNPQHPNRKWRRTAMGLSYSREQSFHNQFSYAGRNSQSAFIDHVVELANGYSVDQLSQTSEDPSTGEVFANSLPGAYYQIYAFDPTVSNGVEGPPYLPLDGDKAVNQYGTFDARGAHSKWSFAYAGNYDNKLYLGFSVNFNRVKYKYDHVLDESVISGEVFRSYRYGEALDVSGNGVSATLGAIYKATPDVQVGVSVSSPAYTTLRESFYQDARVELVQPDNLPTSYAVTPNDFSYSLLSPFRASGGVTYFVGASRSGFLTASLDFVGYKGMRVYARDWNASDSREFKTFYKNEISNTYKNVVNVRLGGEYRVQALRLRAGLAYQPDPYQVRPDGINRSRLIASAGLGVRIKSVFVDLAGNFNTFKSAFTPYVLEDENRFFTAETRNKAANVILTVGTTF